MRSCNYCKRHYKKGSEISFHRFPEDLKQRKLWLQNMNIINWTPNKKYYLCSLHFDDKCLYKHFNRTSLKPGSIPTIFKGTSTSQSVETSTPRSSTSNSASICTSTAKQKLFCEINITELTDKSKRDQEQQTDNDYEVSSTLQKKRIEFGLLHDHRYEISPTSSKKVDQQKRSLKFSKAKVKVLSQHVKRLKLKVASLKNIIKHLIKEKKVSEEYIQTLKQYVDEKV